MATPADLKVLNDRATSQRDRVLSAPAPERAPVDGRTLPQLLSFGAGYGRLIRFYDLTDLPDGTWTEFFSTNRSVALALQVGLDIQNVEAEFDRLLSRLRTAGTIEAQRQAAGALVVAILRLIRLLDGDADTSTIEAAMGAAICSEHRGRIAEPARRLVTHLGGNPLEHGLRRAASGAARHWVEQLAAILDELGSALLGTLEQNRAAASAQLDHSLRTEGHAPQAALYNAFAILFRHAQDAVNRFPARLLGFYHGEILRQDSRPGRPDQLYLSFTPAKGVVQASVPKGTVFPAGTDSSGATVQYALDEAVSVGQAAVTGLRTLTMTREAQLGNDLLPAQVLSGVADLSNKPPLIARPFPLFGADEPDTSGVLTTTTASLGLALASPTLLLGGGTRTVSLGLTFAPATLSEALDLLRPVGGDPQQALAQLLQAAFTLRYSTAGGWISITSYRVKPPTAGQSAFTLSFTLSADASPFVPLSTKPPAKNAQPAGAVPDDAVPVLVADLRQNAVPVGPADGSVELYPYAVLNGLALSSLSIAVAVDGLTELTLTVPGGKAGNGQPFPLFGSPPVKGAALHVAAPELFVKTLGSFSMRVTWYGLPVTTTGFYGYYRAYVIDADGVKQSPGTLFDNQSFQASLTVVNPGRWTISPPEQGSLYLFRTTADKPVPDPQAAVLAETKLVAPGIATATPPSYYDPAASAVRLALAEPAYAFGNTLYASNTMAASVALTAAASASAQKCSLPGPTADALLDPLRVAVTQSPDKSYRQDVAAAVQQALTQMTGAALTAVQDAITASGAPTALQGAWRASLPAAGGSDPAAALARIGQWIADNRTALGNGAQAPLALAQVAVTDGRLIADTQAATAREPLASARPAMTAAVQTAQSDLATAQAQSMQSCIERAMAGQPPNGFPNQPWLPEATGVSVSYGAAAALPDAGSTSRYFHLLPFDAVAAVDWAPGATVPLLAPVPAEGALDIGLSTQNLEPALLMTLAPPKDGWPDETPAVTWARATRSGWTKVAPLRDGTNGLRNSGIVTFALDPASASTPEDGLDNGQGDAPLWLRASVAAAADAFPLLADITTNTALATWVGPGGADDCGTPLPAGTITAPAAPLPGVGAVAQPYSSFGGRPAARGSGFDLWMSERLRHKGFGIQAWDYARLTLAEFPSLWQAAVVPATDGSGTPAAGHVWLVAVPGPTTPGITDPAVPTCDSTTLGQIATFLEARISRFIWLSVTNPPYQRMKVTAKLLFSDADTVEASAARLNTELVSFLSPWPDPALGPRPDDYYTAEAVARFIRGRPYVRGILSLAYAPDPPPPAPGWYYLTSAPTHDLTGRTAPARATGRRP